MSTPLRIVEPRPRAPARSAAASTVDLSQRIRQLQVEAGRLAREHVEALEASLTQTQRIADEIAQGGDAYSVGVRDVARRLAEDARAKVLTLETIMARI